MANNELQIQDNYPELSMYDKNFYINLYRDCPEPYASTYEIIFEVDGERFYCFIDGCESLLEALGLFFEDHPNITRNMIVDILEDV